MDDVLREYIDRVLRLQQRRSALTLDQSDLEQIAREVGLTDADLAAVDAEVAAHRARAQGFLRHGLVDDALTELEHATALAPHDTDVLMEFADAYAHKWEQGDDAAGDRAHRLALRALDVDAGRDDAFALIARLRDGVRRGSFSLSPQPGAIPIRVAEPDYGLAILPWKASQTGESAEKRYFHFAGWIRNDSDSELIELGGTFLVHDVRGVTHELEAPYALTIVTPPIRPGDTFPFECTWTAPGEDIAEVDFRVDHLDARPAARKYPNGEHIPVAWNCPQPPGIDVAVEVRERSVFAGKPSALLAVTNTGERAAMMLNLDLVDDDKHPTRVAHMGGTPLFPGETRQVFVEITSASSVIQSAQVTEASG